MSYAAQIATARRMLAAKGQVVQMQRLTRGELDVVTDTTTDDVVTVTRVVALLTSAPSRPNRRFAEDASANRVPTDARELLMAGLDIAGATVGDPAPGDVIACEGGLWPVLGSTRLAPDGGNAILFFVRVSAPSRGAGIPYLRYDGSFPASGMYPASQPFAMERQGDV